MGGGLDLCSCKFLRRDEKTIPFTVRGLLPRLMGHDMKSQKHHHALMNNLHTAGPLGGGFHLESDS